MVATTAPPARRRGLVLGGCGVLAAAIFVADLVLPLGVATGLAYVAVVLLAQASPRRADMLWLAGISTALVGAGYAASPEPVSAAWVVAANRLLSVAAVWITAGVGWSWRKAESELRRSERSLATRLRELQSARQHQQASDRRFRALADNVPALFAYVNEHLRYEFVNRGYERWFGVDPEDLIGESIRDFLGEPTFAQTKPHVLEVLSGREVSFDLDADPDGRAPRSMSVQYVPDEDAAGRVRGFYVLAVDRTEAARAEQELRNERDFLENLFEVVPLVVLVLDRAGRIVRFNRYLESLHGRPLAEVRGRDWREVLHPERERERAGREFASCLRGHPSSGSVRPVLDREESEHLIEWYDTPLVDAGGRVTGVLATGLDVTARAKLEVELRQAQKMEAVGRLAGGIAHDFNNLLMGILGCCRMAQERLEEGDPACESIEEIRSAAERGARVTGQLMTFSRRGESAPRRLHLGDVVRENESLIRRLVGEDVEVEIACDADAASVLADEGQLEQVLLNLVVNARDAMREGGRLRVRAGTSDCAGHEGDYMLEARQGLHATLEVSDTGCGMDVETRRRAFEPFFTTKPEGQGTGLGLATVYGIVKGLHGHVHVDGADGEGTTIRVHLPCAAQAPGGEPEETGEDDAAQATRTASVLLVEDELLVRRSVAHILRRLGHEVTEAGGAAEALAACDAGKRHDVLLTDMVMPEVDGARLARQVEERQPGVRTIFMSAYPPALLIEQGRVRPGQPVLEKPFDEEALVAALREALTGDGAAESGSGV